MKKIISLVLMVAMMLSIGISSFAEEDLSITFRGIPWGSSPDEAISMIKEELGLDEIEVSYTKYSSYSLTQYGHEEVSNNIKVPVLECKIDIPDLVVAGYMAKGKVVTYYSMFKDLSEFEKYNIILYFMPVISEDRTTYSLSEHEGALWRAVYPCLVRQTGTTDLYKKLEGLYGKIRKDSVQTITYTKNGLFSTPKYETVYYEYWAAEDGIVEIKEDEENRGLYELDYRCKIADISENARTIQTIRETEIETARKEAEEADTSGTDGL